MFTYSDWTRAYTVRALREGWMIFNGNEIQRDDEAGILADDDEALALVERRAAEGSRMHLMALQIHQDSLTAH